MKICYAIDWNNYPDGEWCPSTYFTEEVRDKVFAARDRRGEMRSLELIELTPELRLLLKMEPAFKGCDECHGIYGHHSQCPEHPRGHCNMGVGCDEAGVCFAAANGEPDRCGKPPLVEEPLFYTCWCNYGATGEGNTLMFALCNTKAAAEKTFRTAFGDYFFQGAETVPGLPVGGPTDFTEYVPAYIIRMYTVDRIPWLQYYQQHHYNLS